MVVAVLAAVGTAIATARGCLAGARSVAHPFARAFVVGIGAGRHVGAAPLVAAHRAGLAGATAGNAAAGVIDAQIALARRRRATWGTIFRLAGHTFMIRRTGLIGLAVLLVQALDAGALAVAIAATVVVAARSDLGVLSAAAAVEADAVAACLVSSGTVVRGQAVSARPGSPAPTGLVEEILGVDRAGDDAQTPPHPTGASQPAAHDKGAYPTTSTRSRHRAGQARGSRERGQDGQVTVRLL